MSVQNVENTVEKRNFLASQNDVGPAQSTTAAMTAVAAATKALGAVAERTSGVACSETRSATMAVDEEEYKTAAAREADSARSSSSSGVGGGANEKRRSSDGAKRKTRRGKAKRGKRSSSVRSYPKSQWNFLAPNIRSAANKRRSARAASSRRMVVPLKDAFRLSDQPPLVPYNTNRFLMEDHMPHVLTPSGRTRDSSFSIDSEENYFHSLPEDEEEFLTKEFSSVYEDARSERLEELSKSQLIQEYLQLEANYEQVMRRFNAAKSSLSAKEESESGAVNSATPPTALSRDAPEGPGADRRRLEDRVRELTTENLELRHQLEHAARIGMVLSAKSSPRPQNAAGNNLVEQMDSSSCTSSEDSESDSSSSSSSSSDAGGASSSSSMSDIDDNETGMASLERAPEDRLPLVPMAEVEGANERAGSPEQPNGYHQLNGVLEQNGNGEHYEASSSPRSINSPVPPLN